MDRASLKPLLREALRTWSSKSYDVLLSELGDGQVVVYDAGATEEDGQIEVLLLERTPEYLHVCVSISDAGWRTFLPLSTSFLVYRDGRIDRPEL